MDVDSGIPPKGSNTFGKTHNEDEVTDIIEEVEPVQMQDQQEQRRVSPLSSGAHASDFLQDSS